MKPLLLVSSGILLASPATSLALDPSPTLVTDIYVGGVDSIPDFSRPKVVGDSVLFTARGSVNSNYELWTSDGTEAGTTLLKDIYPGTKSSDISTPMLAGGNLFFAATDSSGKYLWKSDGSAGGTVKLTGSIDKVGASPELQGTAGNLVYFRASSPATGYELWRSDGTPAGTFMLADIRQGTIGSYPSVGVAIGNVYYFVASDTVHGIELWKTDGTTAGTVLVKDISPPATSEGPQSLTVAGGKLYFVDNDGVHGQELWCSDGTAAGTEMAVDLVPGAANGAPSTIFGAGGLIYFYNRTSSEGPALWRSDGTAAGTFPVLSQVGYPISMRAWGDKLFFSPGTSAPGNVSKFWVTDGTVGGTVPYKAGINFYPQVILGTAGSGFYFCSGSGGALWQSDGTTAGTYVVADLTAGNTLHSFIPEPVMFGSKILLTASDNTHGRELRAFDTASPSLSKPEISGITKREAKIKVAVNPNGVATTATLRFGPTSAYGTTINLPTNADTLFHSFDNSLSNLTPGTLYHYEISATSTKGTRVSTGTFSTIYTREDWRMANFGATENGGIAADSQDPDRDGLSNLVEYAFGLDPKASDPGKLPKAILQNNILELSFTQPPGISDVIYGAEWSASMQAGTWQTVVDGGSGEFHKFQRSAISDRGAFMRLTVTPK